MVAGCAAKGSKVGGLDGTGLADGEVIAVYVGFGRAVMGGQWSYLLGERWAYSSSASLPSSVSLVSSGLGGRLLL